jgi:hypothetical protein
MHIVHESEWNDAHRLCWLFSKKNNLPVALNISGNHHLHTPEFVDIEVDP